MRPAEREQRRDAAHRDGVSPAPVVPVPAASDVVLGLQRTAGNAAVTRLLSGRAVQRAGWPEAREKGWNQKSRGVAGTQRIPIEGLSQGHQSKNPSGHTKEFAGDKASGRAIVVVPDGTDLWGGKLEVLLLFHGLGESVGIGYRERTTEDPEGAGGPGTVHDVEADLIPQQLASSGRNMIAILPQGKAFPTKRGEDLFGISDSAKYVGEVLTKVTSEPGLRSPDPDKAAPTPYRIVSAGHSGGGRPAVASAKALQGGDWHRAAPLLLFDGINGPNELANIRDMLKGWLETDHRHLSAAADAGAELKKRGLKFRSTYSTGSWEAYRKNHEGGDYVSNKVKVQISEAKSLNGFLRDWFDANATGTLAPHKDEWKRQYQTAKVTGSHHHQIGMRGKASARERDAAGVPTYETDRQKKGPKQTWGNLEQGLDALAPDAMRPAKAAGLLEEMEPTDDPGKVFA
jgi:hypothetical protein